MIDWGCVSIEGWGSLLGWEGGWGGVIEWVYCFFLGCLVCCFSGVFGCLLEGLGDRRTIYLGMLVMKEEKEQEQMFG